MATKSEEFFHDKWLGHVQTESDGLVVAKPVLLAAGCAHQQPPEVQEKLRELCPLDTESAHRRIADVMQLFQQLLDFDPELFESAEQIPDEVSLYAPEGPQTIRPTFGLLRQDEPKPREGAGSPASNAAAKYVALIWDVTTLEGEVNNEALGLVLDKPETITGDWSYPVAAKFDRLLRHCQVPVGILTNREVIRLVYAPHGESSGHITFRVDDMATVGGRPILDAMIMLLCANQWFGVSPENSLPSLLRRSREYQGTVTEDLAEQVFSGLEALLKGFQTAAERDKSGLLQTALERDQDYLYRGLLTVMLRLVFILYAEDRSLLPVEHPLYAKRMSLLGLFEKLQRDNGNFPDSMSNRFGAWSHIISLCRAIYLGVEHGDFHIPPRQGDLFDPHIYSFLEGWSGESAPIVTQHDRSDVRVPTLDDGAVFVLLRSLLIFQGQRLNYRTLDVEQIGSVYEALMGYHVTRCESAAVAIKLKNKKGSPKYWVSPEAVLARPSGQRVKWLQEECGFDKPVATKIKKILDDVKANILENSNAAIEALLGLAAGKKEFSFEQCATIGQYVLQPGEERRNSGSHYTPRSLTEPIVRKTLEPLILCLGDSPTADQLFELKLCDPAMGSGAFLVECCRQLADEVVTAWARAHEIEGIAATCPEGDVVAHARRLVAQRCLYGVDKNAMAVQLAKLSLWLFTLARELPFTFLDHSLRCGDSLVGLNFEQIKAFHWKPEKQLTFLEAEIKRALDEVVIIRQDIHRLAGDTTPEGQKLKVQRLFDANDATEKVRKIADVCVGAFFAKAKDKDRLAERQMREDRVKAWFDGDVDTARWINEWTDEIRLQHSPFHWWIEFPEVFYDARIDPLDDNEKNRAAYFDAFIGNPPFAGKNSITAASGDNYLAWLKVITESAHGNADLSAHFFRRAALLLGDHGTFGLVATSSIAQGDTRETGLKYLLATGWKIYDGSRSLKWPGAASVTVSIVNAARGRPASKAKCQFSGHSVEIINSRLRPKPERADAKFIQANSGFSFIGSYALGLGFVLTPEQRNELINTSPKNAERIFPYIGGSEVNSSPTQSFDRYIINFEEMELEQAKQWPDLLNILESSVRLERLKQKDTYGQLYWWRYLRSRPELYEALSRLDNCLVIPQQFPNRVRVAIQPTDRVLSQKLIIIPLSGFSAFSVLQSSIHNVWTQQHCGEMGAANTPVYLPSDCFDTFAFPEADPLTIFPKLEEIGEYFYKARQEYMLESSQGLTKTYNALLDPENQEKDILELRKLHEMLDRAVLDAYGWSDIEVPPCCPITSKETEAAERFYDDVIDRLYELNEKRVAEEIQELKSSTVKKVTSKKIQPIANPTLSLFDVSDEEGSN